MRRAIVIKIVIAITVILFPTIISASKVPSNAQKDNILNKAYRMQIPFIENKGQIENEDVSFYSRTFGGTLFVERNGTLTYNLPLEHKGGLVIKEIFTDKKIDVKGLDPSITRINYFKGKDKSKWKTNVTSYNSVTLGEIYRGIELELKAYGNNVEKLFTVSPGKNPGRIEIKLEGAKGLKVNEKGELEVKIELYTVKFTKPLAYQKIESKKKPVEVAYVIKNKTTYGFKIGDYDTKRQLIIDPLLASTFIGGQSVERGNALVLDESGNVYVTGYTSSSNYPITPDVYDERYNSSDVFVSKLDSSLSILLASTFIGGQSVERGNALVLDESGNVYMTGDTSSSDYPTTSGAYDENYKGGTFDIFISKLDSNLSSLLASTFVGGDSLDEAHSLGIDGSGNVYVTGNTSSSDYPTTSGAYDRSHNDSGDVFISKLDGNLSSLLASTFIGGSYYDRAHSLVLDESGNVYMTGDTSSSDYPTTSGAYDESFNYDSEYLFSDIFISKLDGNLSSLLASTFIGGDSSDNAYSLILGESGNVYVTGRTSSPDYPTTPAAYDKSWNGYYSIFVSKFNSNLITLLASTFIGVAWYWDTRNFLALDGSGNIYVTGSCSSRFPTTLGAYDESYNGGEEDVFVSKIDSNLSSLLASTFIGGQYWDTAHAIVLDKSGNVYVTGRTNCSQSTPHISDYPTTPGAYDESHNGGDLDIFISKLDSNLSADDGIITTTTTTKGNETTTTIDGETTTTTYVICPILCIYDDYSEETEFLRHIRDNVLNMTQEGQEIIRLYYEWSPIIVKAMKDDEEFEENVKEMIDGVMMLMAE